jgi:hypothetical protein
LDSNSCVPQGKQNRMLNLSADADAYQNDPLVAHLRQESTSWDPADLAKRLQRLSNDIKRGTSCIDRQLLLKGLEKLGHTLSVDDLSDGLQLSSAQRVRPT